MGAHLLSCIPVRLADEARLALHSLELDISLAGLHNITHCLPPVGTAWGWSGALTSMCADECNHLRSRDQGLILSWAVTDHEVQSPRQQLCVRNVNALHEAMNLLVQNRVPGC